MGRFAALATRRVAAFGDRALENLLFRRHVGLKAALGARAHTGAETRALDAHLKLDFIVLLQRFWRQRLFQVGAKETRGTAIAVKALDLQRRLFGFLVDSQRVDLGGSEILPGAKLVIGFDWEPEETPFSIYVGAHVAREPDSVSVFRSGETGEQSEANAEYSTSYGLKASLNMRF